MMEKIYRMMPALLIVSYVLFFNDNKYVSWEGQMIALGVCFLLSAFCILKLVRAGQLEGVRLLIYAAFVLIAVAISAYYLGIFRETV